MGLLVTLAVRVLSVLLVCLGLAFFLWGVFAFQPSVDATTVIVALLALIGAYLLMRVGRDVWRDLTESLSRRKPTLPEDETADREDEV